MSKKTVIIGASTNPSRYSHMAAESLRLRGHEIVALSIHPGKVDQQPFLDLRERPSITDVDTITLYINPTRQSEWEEYIISLRPNRIIFNPGPENKELALRASKLGIETLQACTLVMLSSNQY